MDIVVSPNRTWVLKDEAELTDATQLGLYTTAEAAEVRTSLNNALTYLESWCWPFNTDLIEFAPDNAWPIPNLPRSCFTGGANTGNYTCITST